MHLTGLCFDCSATWLDMICQDDVALIRRNAIIRRTHVNAGTSQDYAKMVGLSCCNPLEVAPPRGSWWHPHPSPARCPPSCPRLNGVAIVYSYQLVRLVLSRGHLDPHVVNAAKLYEIDTHKAYT